MRPHCLLLGLALCLVGCRSTTATPPAGDPVPRAVAAGGMVATVHPLATAAGVRALEAGGNAVDAAVAAALALGVVDGHNSGLGGGCFLILRTPGGEVIALDGRETAPAAATRDMFLRDGEAAPELSQTGALAAGVPGSLAVYERALADHGRKTLADLLRPAADLAADGFPIDATYARRLADEADTLRRFPSSAAALLKPDGTPYVEGEILRQPDLAATYRAIAANGPAWFYRGPFAVSVEDWMRDHGGLLTADDFAAYAMVEREPVVSTYRGRTVYGFPPPSSGGVHVAQILNILENFDAADSEGRGAADRLHVVAEAMKLAFADRAYWLGDPAFAAVPTAGLASQAYADELAERIDVGRVTPVRAHGTPPGAAGDVFGVRGAGVPPASMRGRDARATLVALTDGHTTHVAAADAEGYWVALTATVNTAFGSKVVVPGTGVILNNQMDDFSARPGVPNYFGLVGSEANAVAPGKRPLSSMSPTIVTDRRGRPVLTLGAAGGPRIITNVVGVIGEVIDRGEPLPDAVAAPRLHHQWSPDVLYVESALAAGAADGLRRKGHAVEVVAPGGPVGTVQAIASDGRAFVGVADPRVGGSADGVD